MSSFSGSLSSFRYAASVEEQELKRLGLSGQDAEAFVGMVKQAAALKDRLPSMDWTELRPVDVEDLVQYSSLTSVSDEDKADVLSRFAVVKLNGGVGSTMGLRQPKALLNVSGSETFLSAAVSSVAALNSTFSGLFIPLVFMNSFATHDPTVAALDRFEVPHGLEIFHFSQRKFPRLDPSTLRPVPKDSSSPDECWYPPGHGDIFEMIVRSGMAAQLIARGQDYAFVSNIDNLAADLDAAIARHMINRKFRVMIMFGLSFSLSLSSSLFLFLSRFAHHLHAVCARVHGPDE